MSSKNIHVNLDLYQASPADVENYNSKTNNATRPTDAKNYVSKAHSQKTKQRKNNYLEGWSSKHSRTLDQDYRLEAES